MFPIDKVKKERTKDGVKQVLVNWLGLWTPLFDSWIDAETGKDLGANGED